MNTETLDEDKITLGDINAFVGRNSDRYFKKWSAMIQSAGSIEKAAGKPSWNWAAFIFTVGWLFYRKMYGVAVVVVIVLLAPDILSTFTSIDIAQYVVLAVPITLGLVGDGLYLRHFQKQSSAVRETAPNDMAPNQTLQSIGGTSPVAGLAGVVAVIGMGIVIDYGLTGKFPFDQYQVEDTPQQEVTVVNDAVTQPNELLPSGLLDLNGVWSTEHGQTLTVVMDGRGSSILVDDVQLPITITEVFGDDIDIVQFQPGIDPGVNDYWAFYKIWNEAHTEFTVRLVDNIGGANELGYMADLSPNEVRQLQRQLNSAPPIEGGRMYDILTMTRPDQGMGTQRKFNFMADGYDGQLTMSYLSGRRNIFILNTINVTRFHTCGFEFIAEDNNDGVYQTVIPDTDCTMTVKIDGDFADVSSDGRDCYQYCGVGGWFEGRYVEMFE